MKKHCNSFLILLLLVLFILSSCSDDITPSIEYNNKKETVSQNDLIDPNKIDISESDAEKVAKIFIEKQNSGNLRSISLGEGLQIKNTFSIPDSMGNPTLYIINFNPSGFCIVSSTKKTVPVLAFSETGYFEFNKEINMGLAMWLEETLGYIVNTKNAQDSSSFRASWMEFEDYSQFEKLTLRSSSAMSQAYSKLANEIREKGNEAISLSSAMAVLPNDLAKQFQRLAAGLNSPEAYSIVEIIDKTQNIILGPLIKTNWNQSYPFNLKVPNDWAGCTAVAAGQIMYFFKKPASFNWNNMADNKIGLFPEDVAFLMFDLGKKIKMDYRSDGSGSNNGNVKEGLEKNYSYSVTEKDFNYLEVQSYLNNKKYPVYMSGSRTSFLGIIYKDGHAWVCEGYKKYTPLKYYKLHLIRGAGNNYSYTTDGYENIDSNSSFYSTLSFYMNWGWGSSYNGWYGFQSSKPNSSDNDYKHNRKVLYIEPK